MAQIATLQELETHWCVQDLLDAHEALDIKQALEEESQRLAEKKNS